MELDWMVIIGRMYSTSTCGSKDHQMDHCQKYSVCDCYYMQQDRGVHMDDYKKMDFEIETR